MDMGVDEADCDKYVALRDAMKEDGLILFKRGDWVAQKQKSVRRHEGRELVTGIHSRWRDAIGSHLPAVVARLIFVLPSSRAVCVCLLC